MQRDCTCACAVACLHPHSSISNVVASVTIHDDMNIFIRDVCTKKHDTIVEGRRLFEPNIMEKCLTCKSFLTLGFWWRKANRTIRWLIPFAVSLRRAGVEQLYQGKPMIGGIGNMLFSNYSKTE